MRKRKEFKLEKYAHEGYKVGQLIKAFDFKPRPDTKDYFKIGYIVEVNRNGTELAPYAHYKLWSGDDDIYVPMQVSMLEYEERVTLIQDIT